MSILTSEQISVSVGKNRIDMSMNMYHRIFSCYLSSATAQFVARTSERPLSTRLLDPYAYAHSCPSVIFLSSFPRLPVLDIWIVENVSRMVERRQGELPFFFFFALDEICSYTFLSNHHHHHPLATPLASCSPNLSLFFSLLRCFFV